LNLPKGYKVNHNPSWIERILGYPRLSRRVERLEREKQEFERQRDNAKNTVFELTIAIAAVIAISFVFIHAFYPRYSYSQYDADTLLYRLTYEDATPQADNGPTNVLGHVSTVRYGLATAHPNKLWDLERAYDNNIMIVLDTLLKPCGVYLITTDSEGQSTTTPVPSDQVPSKYDGFVAGCDPESLVPWWVTDQYAESTPLEGSPPLIVVDPPVIPDKCSVEGICEPPSN
jgi:hypothetical protein